jgi:hypothetical protein
MLAGAAGDVPDEASKRTFGGMGRAGRNQTRSARRPTPVGATRACVGRSSVERGGTTRFEGECSRLESVKEAA